VHSPENHRACENDVSDRNGKQELPAEAHELVVTEARQSAAHPDVNEQEGENLGKEPENALDSVVYRRKDN